MDAGQVLRNPMAGPLDPNWPPPSPEAIAFHRRLPGYGPTPLIDAPDLAGRLGLDRVLLKDESHRLGLPAFKFLGASWATYRLLIERLSREPTWATLDDLAAAFAPLRPLELVTSTDGNHGRAVARVARLFGLTARVFVAAGTVPARITAIESEGAIVEEVAGDYDDAVRRSAEAAEAGGQTTALVSDTSWEGYVDTPSRVIEGYDTIFAEIDAALAAPGQPDSFVVVVPIGVGALAAAAVLHYRLRRADRPTTLIGVEPVSADCVLRSLVAGRRVTVPGPHPSLMVGLNCGTPSLVAWPLLSAGVDWAVSIEDRRADEAMVELAQAGIASGATGAAALAGLQALTDWADTPARRTEAGLEPGATALVLCTEGPTDPAHYRAVVGSAPADVAPAREVGHGGL